MIPILLGVSIIVFLLVAAIPGDAIDAKFGQSKLTPERIAEMKAFLGLDQPVGIRYVNWLKNALTGNFGFSIQYNEPVSHVIHTYIWNSFLLAIVSFVLDRKSVV